MRERKRSRKRCEGERKEKQKDREEEEIKMRAEIVDERNEYWRILEVVDKGVVQDHMCP